MQKMGGRICDACRTLFYPGDTIIEFCETCASTVWCVFNHYEDGTKELSSIHRTETSAQNWVNFGQQLIKKHNDKPDIKLVNQEISQWRIL